MGRLRPAHPGDWLLVAGDVAEESRVVLDVLAERPDLIKRDFTADAPARKPAGDITYIHTRERFVYLATIMDRYSKKIVDYAIAGTHAKQIDPNCPAKLTIRNCQPIKGVTIFIRTGDRSIPLPTTPAP